MKAVALKRFGGPSLLELTDLPTPTAQQGEVLIELEYTSVNPVDWKICEGLLKNRLPHAFPLIPGWDAAGKIKSVGPSAKRFRPGDEVFAYCRKPVVQWGTYAEFVAIDETAVAPKPHSIGFREAASFPLAALTAWQALFDVARLKAGETILIHAGAGAVGGFAIQFARVIGAEKVITTARQEYHSYVIELGADHAVDYSQEQFVSAVNFQNPKGVDVVFDCVGGDTFKMSHDVLKPGGRLVSILEQPVPDLEMKHQIKTSYLFVRPNGEQLREIAELTDQQKVSPPALEEMLLEKAAEALERVRQRRRRGKMVLKVK